MFRAEILWLANGPTLKMESKLAGEWGKQAFCLLTSDVVPKGLIVNLTEVSYIDSTGECLLRWLGSVGAVFAASGVYVTAVCERLGLSPMHRMSPRRHESKETSPQVRTPMSDEAGPVRNQKEEQ
jgi:hypothetical protein